LLSDTKQTARFLKVARLVAVSEASLLSDFLPLTYPRSQTHLDRLGGCRGGEPASPALLG